MKKGTTITINGRDYVSVRMLPPARGHEIQAALERYLGSAPVAPAWPIFTASCRMCPAVTDPNTELACGLGNDTAKRNKRHASVGGALSAATLCTDPRLPGGSPSRGWFALVPVDAVPVLALSGVLLDT